LNEDFLSKRLVIEKSGETTPDSKKSDSSSAFSKNLATLYSKESDSSSAFLKNSPKMVRVDEESNYCSYSQISATDSLISD